MVSKCTSRNVSNVQLIIRLKSSRATTWTRITMSMTSRRSMMPAMIGPGPRIRTTVSPSFSVSTPCIFHKNYLPIIQIRRPALIRRHTSVEHPWLRMHRKSYCRRTRWIGLRRTSRLSGLHNGSRLHVWPGKNRLTQRTSNHITIHGP